MDKELFEELLEAARQLYEKLQEADPEAAAEIEVQFDIEKLFIRCEVAGTEPSPAGGLRGYAKVIRCAQYDHKERVNAALRKVGDMSPDLRAVNNHDALLAALERLAPEKNIRFEHQGRCKFCGSRPQEEHHTDCAWAQARAAIASAKGKHEHRG